MQELFFTILVIWLLFKIFAGRSGSGNVFTFNTFTNQQSPQQKKEGEVKINQPASSKSNKKKDPDEGDYVDFEEIK